MRLERGEQPPRPKDELLASGTHDENGGVRRHAPAHERADALDDGASRVTGRLQAVWQERGGVLPLPHHAQPLALPIMAGAEQVPPLVAGGRYTYKIDKLIGMGWLLVGDALRSSTHLLDRRRHRDVLGGLFAFEAIDEILTGAVEGVLSAYERRVTDGVDAWYDLIALFYKLQNLFTFFAVKREFREKVVRILQGNLYMPESLVRAREMIGIMEARYERVMDQPDNLLRPGARAQLGRARV